MLKFSSLSLAILALFSVAISTNCAANQSQFYAGPFGKDYHISTATVHQVEAKQLCTQLGANLLSFDDWVQLTYVFFEIGLPAIGFWTSLEKTGSGSEYRFHNGSSPKHWPHWRNLDRCAADCCAIYVATTTISLHETACRDGHRGFVVCERKTRAISGGNFDTGSDAIGAQLADYRTQNGRQVAALEQSVAQLSAQLVNRDQLLNDTQQAVAALRAQMTQSRRTESTDSVSIAIVVLLIALILLIACVAVCCNCNRKSASYATQEELISSPKHSYADSNSNDRFA